MNSCVHGALEVQLPASWRRQRLRYIALQHMGSKIAMVDGRTRRVLSAFIIIALVICLYGSTRRERTASSFASSQHTQYAVLSDGSQHSALRRGACSDIETEVMVNQAIQEQYCLRFYTDDTGVPAYLEPLTYRGPHAQQMKIYGYRENDIVSQFVRRKGAWEEGYIQATHRALELVRHATGVPRSELTFVDIGANIGTHALYVAQAGYKVIAYEPMTTNEAAIRASLCASNLTDRFTLIPKGMGDSQQVCRIISHGDNHGDGGIECGLGLSDPVKQHYVVRGRTQVTTLDDALRCPRASVHSAGGATRLGRIAGVKMDVEGYEANVIRGGENFWQAMQVPFINYEQDLMETADRKWVMDFFLGVGYHFNCADTGDGAEVFDAVDDEKLKCHEVFMYHSDLLTEPQGAGRRRVKVASELKH